MPKCELCLSPKGQGLFQERVYDLSGALKALNQSARFVHISCLRKLERTFRRVAGKRGMSVAELVAWGRDNAGA